MRGNKRNNKNKGNKENEGSGIMQWEVAREENEEYKIKGRKGNEYVKVKFKRINND